MAWSGAAASGIAASGAAASGVAWSGAASGASTASSGGTPPSRPASGPAPAWSGAPSGSWAAWSGSTPRSGTRPSGTPASAAASATRPSGSTPASGSGGSGTYSGRGRRSVRIAPGPPVTMRPPTAHEAPSTQAACRVRRVVSTSGSCDRARQTPPASRCSTTPWSPVARAVPSAATNTPDSPGASAGDSSIHASPPHRNTRPSTKPPTASTGPSGRPCTVNRRSVSTSTRRKPSPSQ